MTKRGRLSDGDDHDDEHPLKKGKRTEQVRKQREEAAFLNRRFKRTANSRGHKKPERAKREHYVFVSNLSKRVEEKHLKKRFKRYGKVKDAVIIPQPDRPVNYGFIYFMTGHAAEKALEMDGEPFKNEPIHVEAGDREVYKVNDVYYEGRGSGSGRVGRKRGRY